MSHLTLLKNYPIVRRMATLQLLAYFGAWFSNVAIYTLLVQLGADSIMISIVVAMHFIPGIILSPFSGTLVDRFDAKKLMLTLLFTEFIMTVSFLMIDSLGDIWLLLILLFIRMSAASMFFTTEMTIMPKVIENKILAKVNELHSIIWSFTFTAGMALGGIVVNQFGIATAFIVDGGFFILALLILSKTLLEYEKETSHEKIFTAIQSGINYIKQNPKLIHLIILHGAVGLTAFDTIVTLLADYHYKYIVAVALAIGITNAMRSLALMIGPFLISSWVNNQRLYYLFLFQGIAIMVWALLQKDFYLGLVGTFLTGLVTTTLWSHTYALLQEQIEAKYLGRVLAYNEMFFMLSNVLTTIFIGIMAQYASLELITALLGVGFIVVAIYYKKIILGRII